MTEPEAPKGDDEPEEDDPLARRREVTRRYFDAQQRAIKAILNEATHIHPREPASTPKPKTVKDRLDDIDIQDRGQTLRLKRHLAYGAFIALALQLVVANLAFYIYGFRNCWQVEPEVMIAWLSATVVETLGVILIIARNLFPPGDEPK